MDRSDAKTTSVVHAVNGRNIDLHFHTPNSLSAYRATTFSTKEPDTLEWIDKYAPENGVMFDIGANVGLYSIYYAVSKKGTVYSFEPSVFNLKLLVKNINLNHCEKNVFVVSNPLSYTNGFADFNLQNTEEGGALSSFGVEYGHDGKTLNKQLSYKMLGFSLDHMIQQKLIPSVPSLIKVDVDGIEHLILRGAETTLADAACRSVLIEVNESFIELYEEVSDVLTNAGFKMVRKRSSDLEANEISVNHTFNQIWVK